MNISQAILVTILSLLATEISSQYMISVPPGCPDRCGNLTIRFPFGSSSNCSLDDSFLIACNHDYNPPKPFLNAGTIEVVDISLDGLLRVASPVATDCYDSSGSQTSRAVSDITLSEFRNSSTRNKFTAVGCDTHALIQGSGGWSGGCVSWCDSFDSVANGTCSGIGCCQTSIPKGVQDFHVDIRSFKNHTRVNAFSPCGYAFVVENEAFHFSPSHLKSYLRIVPVVLDWSVGNLSCHVARKNYSIFECRAAHSECVDSGYGPGYLCKCLTGFQGNPYLIHGCQDIDECAASQESQPCEGTCANMLGSYSCSCPKGFEGDGKKDGSGCHPKSRINSSTVLYVASGFMVPAIGSSWIFWRRKQKKVNTLRRNSFLRHGGPLLQGRITIFKAEDLKKATNNYNENNVLSVDEQFGTNYRGMLPDGRIVTITKCDALDDDDVRSIEVFVDKIISLSHIHHRNVVQLLGCCLETPVPLLVHEFFEFETLFYYLNDDGRACHLSWDVRLRIAAETARVLGYMHSCSDGPIIHGSLSSSSISLHHGYNVRLHDYATSFLNVHFYPARMAYLDPEYFLTHRLTVKSDVYSFGVILAEMLTGKTAFSGDRAEGEEHLAQYFVNRGYNLPTILDPILGTDGKIEMLAEVAKLAERCLSDSPGDRPSMTQVVIALGIARSMDSSSKTMGLDSSQGTAARRVVRRNQWRMYRVRRVFKLQIPSF